MFTSIHSEPEQRSLNLRIRVTCLPYLYDTFHPE